MCQRGGISREGEIVDLGSDFGIIQKSGAWYSYNGAKIAQGRDAGKQFMPDNPEVAAEIEQKVKEKAAARPVKQGVAAIPVAAGDDGEDDF